MKKGERKYPCNCGDGGCWKCWPSNFTAKALAGQPRPCDLVKVTEPGVAPCRFWKDHEGLCMPVTRATPALWAVAASPAEGPRQVVSFNEFGDCINPVYQELRRIYCCKGAEFSRPTLEKAWKEIEHLLRLLNEMPNWVLNYAIELERIQESRNHVLVDERGNKNPVLTRGIIIDTIRKYFSQTAAQSSPDAKVKEIAREVTQGFAKKYGNVGISYSNIDMVTAILRPYFPADAPSLCSEHRERKAGCPTCYPSSESEVMTTENGNKLSIGSADGKPDNSSASATSASLKTSGLAGEATKGPDNYCYVTTENHRWMPGGFCGDCGIPKSEAAPAAPEGAAPPDVARELNHIKQETRYEDDEDVTALRERLHKVRYFASRAVKQRRGNRREMEPVFKGEKFLAARKWRHSDKWREAYYTIQASHTDRDAYAMSVYADLVNAGATAEVRELRAKLEAANAYSDAAWSSKEAAESRLKTALEALRKVLSSATPNEKEHPTMFAAWKEAEAALSDTAQSSEGGRRD